MGTQSNNRINRRAKACNTCRRKKVKCDGKRPICSSCNTFNLSCTFQDAVRQPNRSGPAYVEELERRVKSLEQQLQQQVRLGHEAQHGVRAQELASMDTAATVTDGCERNSYDATGNTYGGLGQMPEKDGSTSPDGDGIDQASSVVESNDGKMRFFGASSGFCAPSSTREAGEQESKNWTAAWRAATQQNASRWQLTSWIPRILQDGFDQRVFQPLPSKQTAVQLVEEFFATFNQAIPLFDESSFKSLLKRQFSWNPDDSPSWWVSLNIVLAFSYRERAHASSDASDNWQLCFAHVRNAMNAVVELFMRNTDLLAVQGILGLALFFQGTPNSQALFMFAAVAMRMSHSIGLHRNNILRLTPSQIEERRRTYWIAFILDADISLRVGRPPIQDLEDYDTSLPAEAPYDGKGVICLEGIEINLFRLLAQFALIQRHLYTSLYTVAVHRQPRANMASEVKACEKALQEWRDMIPLTLQPQRTFVVAPDYFLQHLLRLHFAYHFCYANLHQVCMLRGQTEISTSQGAGEGINSTIVQSLESARSAVELLRYIRLLGSTYEWNMLYFPAAASVALALHIMVYRNHQHAQADLSAIRETVDFLSNVSSREPGTYVEYILGVCSDLQSAAVRALTRGHTSHLQETSVDDSNGRDKDKGISSHMDITASPTGLKSDDAASNFANEAFENGDFGALDDLAVNWQWSMSPFWNWQDLNGY